MNNTPYPIATLPRWVVAVTLTAGLLEIVSIDAGALLTLISVETM